MNVLLIGSGGREHALAWKMAQSPNLTKLFIAPGNAGTASVGENITIDVENFTELKKIAIEKKIDMVVVGPEVPLVKGIHDYFLNDDELKKIAVIGPVKKAAMLEGSKDFAKEFMKKNNIPTARFKTFDRTTINESPGFLNTLNPPFVLKADGLAAGKGVLICESRQQAEQELHQMIEGLKFGEASEKVVIEEFLTGIECSVFVLADGQSYKILPVAKDYKRIGDGDTGLNTGGMGSVSPVPFADAIFMNKVEKRIIIPTIEGLQNENINYKGFIFFGLMNVDGDPFVIEYNVRMGDPEAEAVIPRIKSDLLELFLGVANQTLHTLKLEVDDHVAASVFLVSGGYPGNYTKGSIISGTEDIDDSVLFHGGTRIDKNSGKLTTNGGRVLAITSLGNSITDAVEKCIKNAERIHFEGKYYRKDIGLDLMKFRQLS